MFTNDDKDALIKSIRMALDTIEAAHLTPMQMDDLADLQASAWDVVEVINCENEVA